MKAKKIGYWAATVIVAVLIATGGAANLSSLPENVAGMAHLGYPPYFAIMLGAWKVLGAIVILVPKFPRLKEWAYAGMLVDLTGAVVSHAVNHDSIVHIASPTVLAGMMLASWALRPEGRVLGKIFQEA